MAQFGTIITNIGLAKITNAQVTQDTVDLMHIALGDGGGAYYVPSQSQTALKNELWRGVIADMKVDENNPNRISISAYISSSEGGFTIREIGLFDTENNLIALSLYPEQYKPQLSEGVSEDVLIHFEIETSNASVVNLAVDPTIIIASRKYVDEKVASAIGSVGTNLSELQQQLTEHLADYTQLKGDLSTLKTTAKDSIPNIVNELFTNVSDGKSLVGRAITDVDDSVVIPTDPTFEDLAGAIGQIKTGKKYAIISTTSLENKRSYRHPDGGYSSLSSVQLDLSTIDFEPRLIVVRHAGLGSQRVTTWFSENIYVGSSDVANISYSGQAWRSVNSENEILYLPVELSSEEYICTILD